MSALDQAPWPAFISRDQRTQITRELTAIIVAEGVTVEAAVGKVRNDRHLHPARRACWRHLAGLGWSHGMIGRLFGRDASTIHSAIGGAL